jgi:hypothetical protein
LFVHCRAHNAGVRNNLRPVVRSQTYTSLDAIQSVTPHRSESPYKRILQAQAVFTLQISQQMETLKVLESWKGRSTPVASCIFLNALQKDH